jgi:hypothetical protein
VAKRNKVFSASFGDKYSALCIKRTKKSESESAALCYPVPMQDKSIDGALLAPRKNIIRGRLDGLAHVEALLLLRGVDMPRVLPVKRPDAARRGHMSRMVLYQPPFPLTRT